MEQCDLLIIGGPRKYKETGPLSTVGFPFAAVEYRDSGPGKFFRLICSFYRYRRCCSFRYLFSDMLNASGVLVLMLARLTGMALILRIRGEKFSQERTTLRVLRRQGLYREYLFRLTTFALSRFVIRHADALIPDSAFGKNGMLTNTRIAERNVSVVPIPVRFDRIVRTAAKQAALKEELGIGEYTHVMTSVTGFNYSEKIRGLMDALPQLVRTLNRREDTVLLIAGDGVLMPWFKAFMDRRPSPHIRLLGYCGDVEKLYASTDLFVHFSYQDGCPNILLEAMIAGIPVVANNFISFAERIESGKDGILTDLTKPDELANVLDRLLDDPELRQRLGRQGQERVRREHSEAVIGRQLQAVLTAFTSGAGAADG